jgi:hypothetical protein
VSQSSSIRWEAARSRRTDRAGRGCRADDAALADDLDADLVPVARDHVRLDRSHAPAGGGELDQLHVPDFLAELGRGVHPPDVDLLDLLLDKPPGRVDVVDRRVDDDPRGVNAGVDVRVSVPPLEHHRRSHSPGRERLLDRHVLRVVATHEPDLHQFPAQPGLGLHDFQCGFGAVRQRLLAQHRLLRLQALQHQRRVGRVGRGDHDGLDVLVPNQLRPVRVDGGGTVPLGDLSGPLRVHVRDGRQPRVRRLRVEVLGVHAAHPPRPDHADRDLLMLAHVLLL